MSRAERASREPREPRELRARDPPARHATARLTDFSDEALLAELGDAGDGDGPASDGGETFESLDVLERRLRLELARMPDSTPCDEEEAIRREIEATDDEPDEATALYLSLMQDERALRAGSNELFTRHRSTELCDHFKENRFSTSRLSRDNV